MTFVTTGRWTLLIALMAGLLVMAACGDDSDNGGDSANNAVNNDENNDENNDVNNDEDLCGNGECNFGETPGNCPQDCADDENNDDNNDVNNLPMESTIGQPCTGNGECGLGGFCVTEDNGFADGYCISGCNPFDAVPCDGDDNPCVRLGDNDLCVDGCQSDDECRDGYACADYITPGESFCFPAECREDADCGDGQGCNRGSCGNLDAVTGDECTENGQCQPGGLCIAEINEEGEESGFIGGYCSLFGCQDDSDCAGEGAVCSEGENGSFCLDACDGPEDCRPRYSCLAFGANPPVCIPGQCEADDDCPGDSSCVNAICGTPDAEIGDPCEDNSQCASGDLCLTPEGENTQGFADGYCSRLGCSPMTSGDCGESATCIPVDAMGNGICLQSCTEDTECREGGLYQCRLLYEGLPPESTTCLPVECFDDSDCPESFSCDLLNSVCIPE